MTYNTLDKVTAFITRSGPSGVELLLFRHPNAGIQIPAGTVEEGETPEQAALREAAEETGLAGFVIRRALGWRDELPPGATHVIRRKTTVYARPDATSFDWATLRRGIGVRALRAASGFVQVTYEEGDRYPDPTYTSYQITGWVPEDALAAANRRHFFHLMTADGAQQVGQDWQAATDNHIFRPFWARLDDLPEIIAPQRAWLDYVTDTLGYRFGEE